MPDIHPTADRPVIRPALAVIDQIPDPRDIAGSYGVTLP